MKSEMLKYLVWIVIAFTLASLDVVGQFASPVRVSNSPFVFEGLCPDIDGDGDADVIWAESRDGSIYWKENQGQGNFSEDHLIGNEWVYYMNLATADLDNDGDVDIIVWDDWKTIAWYENQGQGSFSLNYLSSEEEPTNHYMLYPSDIDNDGDIDILFTFFDGIYWYENLGGGMFNTVGVLVESTQNNARILSLTVLDIDDDGHKDITASILSGGFGYYKNNGGLDFEPFFIINENVELENTSFWHRVFKVFDVDNDGFEDILYGSHRTVWIFRNLEGGTLDTGAIVLSFENEPNPNRLPDLQVGNFDADENTDLFISCSIDYSGSFVDPAPGLYQYEWDGSQFVLIDEDIIQVQAVESIEMIDADGDDDFDVFAFSSREDAIGYFPMENGDTDVDFVELSKGLGDVLFSVAADIDGDFDLDIVTASSSSGKVAWYERLEDGSFTKQQLILENSIGIDFFLIEDIDLDGDEDFVIREEYVSNTYWLENDGTGSFETGGTLAGLGAGSTINVFFEDFNDDNNLDALSFRRNVNSIRVLGGTGPGTFSSNFESYGINGVGDILDLVLGDIDSDSDLDAICYIRNDEGNFAVGYFENDDNGEFDQFVEIDVLDVDANTSEIEVADIDLDGDIDIVTRSSPSSPTLGSTLFHLWRNEGGGAFSSPEIIMEDFERVVHFELADLDLSGYPDLLISRVAFIFSSQTGLISPPINDYIHILYNNNAGEFGHPTPLYTEGKFFNTFSAADFDSDSDPDLLLSSISMSEVYFLSNEKFSPVRVSGKLFIDANQNGLRDPEEETPEWLEIKSDPPSANYFVSDTGYYFLSYGNFEEEYTISPNIPTFLEITTPFEEYSLSIGSGFVSPDTLDFGIYIPEGFDGLNVNLSGGIPRCNETVPYWIQIANQGFTIENGVIELKLDELISFSSSNLEPDSVVGQFVYWSLDSLGTFQNTMIICYVEMPDFLSIGVPIISSVDVIFFDDDGDESFVLEDQFIQEVVCAYDPNDKQVFPDTGTISLGQNLEYLIRFQNTGTDTAFAVIIEDNLSELLDWESIQYVTSSHDLTNYTVDDNGRLLFNFLDIQLPDSNVDNLGSQGFVQFSIQTFDDLAPNTTIPNVAEIYFDFNPEIVTNVVNSTIECFVAPDPHITFEYPFLSSGVSDGVSYQWYLDAPIFGATEEEYSPVENGSYQVEVSDLNGCSTLSSDFLFEALSTSATYSNSINVYPNPSMGLVNILFSKNFIGDHSLSIFDSTGRLVFQKVNLSDELYILPNGLLPNGFYHLVVSDTVSKTVLTAKIVIVGN